MSLLLWKCADSDMLHSKKNSVWSNTALSATYSRGIIHTAKELLIVHILCRKTAELDKSGNKILINQSREYYSRGL